MEARIAIPRDGRPRRRTPGEKMARVIRQNLAIVAEDPRRWRNHESAAAVEGPPAAERSRRSPAALCSRQARETSSPRNGFAVCDWRSEPGVTFARGGEPEGWATGYSPDRKWPTCGTGDRQPSSIKSIDLPPWRVPPGAAIHLGEFCREDGGLPSEVVVPRGDRILRFNSALLCFLIVAQARLLQSLPRPCARTASLRCASPQALAPGAGP